MSKTAYHIRHKNYVGGSDFDGNAVDEILRVNDGKVINVLIGSLCVSFISMDAGHYTTCNRALRPLLKERL